jgi:hypothetical protein
VPASVNGPYRIFLRMESFEVIRSLEGMVSLDAGFLTAKRGIKPESTDEPHDLAGAAVFGSSTYLYQLCSRFER